MLRSDGEQMKNLLALLLVQHDCELVPIDIGDCYFVLQLVQVVASFDVRALFVGVHAKTLESRMIASKILMGKRGFKNIPYEAQFVESSRIFLEKCYQCFSGAIHVQSFFLKLLPQSAYPHFVVIISFAIILLSPCHSCQ